MNNIKDFESKEEWFFSLWLNELEPYGLINHSVYHPKPFMLSEKVVIPFESQLVTKTKANQAHLAAEHKYQADWIIYWTEKAMGIMFPGNVPLKKSPTDFPFLAHWSAKKSMFYTVIDVKGSFSGPHNNSAVTFPLNQKWTYQKYKIFVQKTILIPRVTKKGKLTPTDALFISTFLPKRLLKTDNSGERRKLNFKYIFVQEFLSEQCLR